MSKSLASLPTRQIDEWRFATAADLGILKDAVVGEHCCGTGLGTITGEQGLKRVFGGVW